jgi:hypothetical protein
MASLLYIFANFFESSADLKYLLLKLKHETLLVKLVRDQSVFLQCMRFLAVVAKLPFWSSGL